jgi:hypothetical protein
VTPWVGIFSVVILWMLARISFDEWGERHPRLPTIPSSSNLGSAMEVEPANYEETLWKWRTYLTSGEKSYSDACLMVQNYMDFRHPTPYEVAGTTSDQAKAWERARFAAENARARYAEQMVEGEKDKARRARRHREHFTL